MPEYNMHLNVYVCFIRVLVTLKSAEKSESNVRGTLKHFCRTQLVNHWLRSYF